MSEKAAPQDTLNLSKIREEYVHLGKEFTQNDKFYYAIDKLWLSIFEDPQVTSLQF